MLAGKWFDMIVGIDIHMVLVPTPAGPVPTPLPHPFTGVVFDPAGLIVGMAISGAISAIVDAPFSGPVFINSMPIGNTGTEGTNKLVMPHIPMPPGTGWAPVPAAPMPPDPDGSPSPPEPTPSPSNDGMIITGSKTVYLTGTNATRLGDMVMTCAEPVRLPSSAVLAVPMGPPVMIGGPPAIDFLAAVMGLIRTKWVSGKLHALMKAPKGSWRSKIICFLTGHPVDVVSGMVITDAVDFHLPGPLPVRFDRTYYSRSDYAGPLGVGWHHSFDQWLQVDDTQIVVRWGDGRDLYFPHLPHREGVSENEMESMHLGRRGDHFVLEAPDRCRYGYGAVRGRSGQLPLQWIENLDGNRTNLLYDQRGRLESVDDCVGRRLGFKYDHADRVISVSAPHPDEQRNRVEVARFDYDPDGDLVAAYDALGNARCYKYKHHLLVQDIDRNGLSFYFAYDGCDKDARCVRTWGDEGLFDHVITYDVEKQLSVVEDSLGSKTVYHTNIAGMVDKKTDPMGAETIYEWDEWGRIVSETNPVGGTVRFEFDSNGRVVKGTDPLGNERIFERDSTGRTVAVQDECGARWTVRYAAAVRPAAVADPVGGMTFYEYDEEGNILSVREPDGRARRFERTRDPAGGLELLVDEGDGGKRRLWYDAWGRLKGMEDALGKSMHLTRDLGGRILEAVTPDGRTTRFAYNGEGKRTEEHYPWGQSIRTEYCGVDRIRATRDDSGASVEYEWDTEGRLARVIREDGAVHRLTRDPCGRVVEQVGFDGRRTRYAYDAHGRVVESVDGLGRSTIYEYDACDRQVGVIGWDGYEARFEFDACGRVIRATNNDCDVEISRDGSGRIVRERAGDVALEFAFDGNGRRTRRSHQLGARTGDVRFEWDDRGSMVGIRREGARVEVERDIEGRPIRLDLGRTLSLLQQFDAFGRLERQEVRQEIRGRLHEIGYEYGSGGELSRRRDSEHGETNYLYDARGRLASARGPSGNFEFRRDAQGRLVDAGSAPIALNELGRAIGAGDDLLEYDDEGQLVARWNAADEGRTLYEYDCRSRLRRVRMVEPGSDPERATERIVEFDYDAFGRRTAKRSAGRVTTFVWDGLNLAFEIDSKNGAASEYYYLPDSLAPICRLSPGGAEYFVSDQVGVPREVFNDVGERLWAGQVTPFGGLERTEGRGKPPPVRLYGQYHDEETGLAYGGARYYDASIGRFLTQDPFGILGGLRSYDYPVDPLRWIDVWALYIIGLSHDKVNGTDGALDQFAKDVGNKLGENVTTYKNVNDLPILSNPATEGWGKWTEDLIGKSEGARFNLNGIKPDVKTAFENGRKVVEQEGLLKKMANDLNLDSVNVGSVIKDLDLPITHVELYQMLRRDGPLDDALKKFFDAAGKEVSIDDLRKQCGI